MYVFTAEEIQSIDKKVDKQEFSLFTLMENAGRNVAEALHPYIDKEARIVILAGKGNNGGDGIVAARYLQAAGFHVTLHLPLGMPKTETAKRHLAFYQKEGYAFSEEYDPTIKPTVIVDALLGVGTKPPLRHDVAEVVRWANRRKARRFAIDIPSGLSADSGEVEAAPEMASNESAGPLESSHSNAVEAGTEMTANESTTEPVASSEPNAESGTPNEESTASVFRADVTFALHGAKPSAFLLPSSRYYGKVVPVSIGLQQQSRVKQTTEDDVCSTLPKRDAAAHKGTFGSSLLIAGSDDMPGSALLAAIGAIRGGTGKLTIGTTRFVASVVAPYVPEAMYMPHGLDKLTGGTELIPDVRAIGMGPGLSDANATETALTQLLETDIPLIVDAGALLPNISWKRDATTVLTPHPGEFSRLTGRSVPDIQANRITLARDYAKRHDVMLVLKGQYTVIAFPDGRVNINPTGNAGLARGGSGDVLTGMITSMMAYYESPEAAVTNAVYVHGLCADVWKATSSETTMVASDFHKLLPEVFRRLE